MSAYAWRPGAYRPKADSGIFTRDERPVAKVHAYEWSRLAVGFSSMGAFVAAGIVHLCVGLPVAVYLVVVGAALAAFTASLRVPDEPTSRTPDSPKPHPSTEVMQ